MFTVISINSAVLKATTNMKWEVNVMIKAIKWELKVTININWELSVINVAVPALS